MRNILIILVIGLSIISCSKKPVKIPEDVLSEAEFIPVLVDVHLAEAMIQFKNMSRNDSTQQLAYGYYSAIYKKYGINAKEFGRSFKFYTSQPELMTSLYDSVIARLSLQNATNLRK